LSFLLKKTLQEKKEHNKVSIEESHCLLFHPSNDRRCFVLKEQSRSVANVRDLDQGGGRQKQKTKKQKKNKKKKKKKGRGKVVRLSDQRLDAKRQEPRRACS